MTYAIYERYLRATLFIFTGLIFLLKNLGLLNWLPEEILSWPMLLFLAGIYLILVNKVLLGFFSGLISIYFISGESIESGANLLHFWPVLLVTWGIFIILHSENK